MMYHRLCHKNRKSLVPPHSFISIKFMSKGQANIDEKMLLAKTEKKKKKLERKIERKTLERKIMRTVGHMSNIKWPVK